MTAVKVALPETIECATDGCKDGTRQSILAHHCSAPGCCWYGPCSVCHHTTWIQPTFSTGPLGKKIMRWTRKNHMRLVKVS